MRAVIGGNVESAVGGIREVIGTCASGCVVASTCRLEHLAEQVSQHRPDIAIIDFSGDVDAAIQCIQEAQEAYSVRVLAVGPSSDAKLILRTLNHGVDKYVGAETMDADLPTALRRIGTEPRLQSVRGRVIAILGVSGGSGTTTLVANIGAEYAKNKKMCMLIDLDTEGGDLAPMLGVSCTHSLADFCQNLNRMDSALLDKCLAKSSDYLSVMPAPSDYQRINAVTARGVRKAINMVRGLAAYVVVDVPSTFRSEQAQALFAADVIALVVRPEYTSVRQASRVLAYLNDLKVPEQRIRLVVNRRVGRRGLRDADIESSLQLPVSIAIPEDSTRMSVAANRGVPLVVDRPRSAASTRIIQLAGSVNGALDTSTYKQTEV